MHKAIYDRFRYAA